MHLKWLIVIIIICIFLCYKRYSIFNTELIESKSGEDYYVHMAHDDNQKAADMLDHLNTKVITLLKHLKKNYKNWKVTKNLLNRYNSDNIKENSPYDLTNDTSYTISKGELLALCLRNDDGVLHDENTLTFVILHELTHIGIDEKNHPPVFWDTFKVILEIAESIGLIYLIDYSLYPIEYCGMTLSDNPHFSR